jgi:signal peptidase I
MERGIIEVVEENRKAKSAFREYAEAIGTALLLALFIRAFIVQAFKIPSGSMIPTLQIGDHILVNKLSYGVRIPEDIFWLPIPLGGKYLVEYRKPQRGDVVVFIYPEDRSKDFIKRVIGVGGDEARDDYGPKRVPENHIFVMGDNRDKSLDSRYWGYVDLKDVKGKAFLIYWSWDGSDRWVRWERLGGIIY